MTLYAGSKKVCPSIGFFVFWLNIDCGLADSVYVYDQVLNGGSALNGGIYRDRIDGGNA